MKALFADGGVGLVGLLFFFIIFVGIAVWAYHPKRKEKIESWKHIPLNEDEHDRA
ncbi:MAG: cbb3-type cytochrome c oxidase subunit 3 [Rickettsiales bacterium]|nr:cbb3-type cytochrome c oxidase subunit 3 [Rickettsiales bacterium]